MPYYYTAVDINIVNTSDVRSSKSGAMEGKEGAEEGSAPTINIVYAADVGTDRI